MSDKSGPYASVDGDELYLPTFDRTYNEARKEAAEWAQEMAWDFGRSRYEGKRQIQIHDHDDWEEAEDNCPQPMCWVFTIYEGTYRRSGL